MKKLLLPVLLLILGVAGGGGAAFMLADPEKETDHIMADHPCGEPGTGTTTVADHNDDHDSDGETGNEYAKLNNQFVVPVVEDGNVNAMVVISLSIEVPAGNKDPIFLAEPKLRDAFLQAMFDHANIGGFSGNFTSTQNMRPLRQDLTRLAKTIVPDVAQDVLILDIVRQDL